MCFPPKVLLFYVSFFKINLSRYSVHLKTIDPLDQFYQRLTSSILGKRAFKIAPINDNILPIGGNIGKMKICGCLRHRAEHALLMNKRHFNFLSPISLRKKNTFF